MTARQTAGGNFLYRFHFELYAMPREWGRWIVGIATFAMPLARPLILTGLWVAAAFVAAMLLTLRFASDERSERRQGVALLLIGMWAMLRVWFAIDRVVLRISTVILLLVGLYAWALLAFVLLCVAESAHRGLMAQRRDAGFYNGLWID